MWKLKFSFCSRRYGCLNEIIISDFCGYCGKEHVLLCWNKKHLCCINYLLNVIFNFLIIKSIAVTY